MTSSERIAARGGTEQIILFSRPNVGLFMLFPSPASRLVREDGTLEGMWDWIRRLQLTELPSDAEEVHTLHAADVLQDMGIVEHLK